MPKFVSIGALYIPNYNVFSNWAFSDGATCQRRDAIQHRCTTWYLLIWSNVNKTVYISSICLVVILCSQNLYSWKV